MVQDGRVLLLTGDGKGKTTAALGLAVRAAGHGMRVCFIQFIKNPRMMTGEARCLERIAEIEFLPSGRGWVPPPGEASFREHAGAARAALEHASGVVRDHGCDVLVLDEVCVALEHGLIGLQPVLDLVRRATGLVLVMTGRHAPPELVQVCDTVTDMRCVRHALDRGRTCQRGVEM